MKKKLLSYIGFITIWALLFAGCGVPDHNGKTDITPGKGTASPAATVTVLPTENAAATDVPPTEVPTEKPTEKPALPTIEPGTGQYAEGIADPDSAAKVYFCENGISGQNQKAEYNTGSMCIQFFPTTTFDAIGVHCPTWTAKSGYYVTFYLYAWAGSYEATIQSDTIAEGEFSDWLDGEEVTLRFDEPLPDGEYLLEMVCGGITTGVWYQPQEHVGQRAYRDDEIWYDASIRFCVYYTQTPNQPFGPLSDSGLE